MDTTRRNFIGTLSAAAVSGAIPSAFCAANDDWREAFRSAGFDPEAKGCSFFVVTSDIHATRAHEHLAEHVAFWNAMRPRPAFLFALGDFADLNQYFGDRPGRQKAAKSAEQHFGAVRKILSEGLDPAIRRVYVVGNHDTYPGETDRALWHAYFPDQPTQCAFDACGLRVIKWDAGCDGSISEKQERWIADEVAKCPADRQLVILVHQPSVGSVGCERDIGRVAKSTLAARPGETWMLAGHQHGNGFRLWDLDGGGRLAVATHAMDKKGWWMYGVKDGHIVARVFRSEESRAFETGRMPAEEKSNGRIPLAYDGRDDVLWNVFVGSKEERACRLAVEGTSDNDSWFYYVGGARYTFPKAKVAPAATRFAILGTLVGKRYSWKPATLSLSADGVHWTDVKRTCVKAEVNEFPIPPDLIGAADLHLRYQAYGMECDECIAGFALLR